MYTLDEGIPNFRRCVAPLGHEDFDDVSSDTCGRLILVQSLTQDLNHFFPHGQILILLCSVDDHVKVLGFV